jgi:plasmid stabilization system protein ParE
MKRVYDVIWTETSEEDLKGTIEYIAGDSPAHAYDVFKEIRRRAANLHTLPDRGRVVPELQDQGITPYRELIVPPWRIIYRVSETRVYVLSVLDSRRNVEDILLKRLISLKL